MMIYKDRVSMRRPLCVKFTDLHKDLDGCVAASTEPPSDSIRLHILASGEDDVTDDVEDDSYDPGFTTTNEISDLG